MATILHFPHSRTIRQPYQATEGDAEIIQFPVRPSPKVVVLYPGGIDDLPYENQGKDEA